LLISDLNVISKRGLLQLAKAQRLDGATITELQDWHRVAQHAAWSNLLDVRQDFPSADQVGSLLIFNIRHNRYRLIVFTVFPKQKLYVKAVLTHKQYDRKEWMKWA
jgi:mRNA interferase HigB